MRDRVPPSEHSASLLEGDKVFTLTVTMDMQTWDWILSYLPDNDGITKKLRRECRGVLAEEYPNICKVILKE